MSDLNTPGFLPEEFVSAREAARKFSSLIEQLFYKERRRYVILHRNQPRAVLLSIDEYNRLINHE